MSKNIILVLMYHRHKLLDLIYTHACVYSSSHELIGTSQRLDIISGYGLKAEHIYTIRIFVFQ
jgi:hypothetical protein